MKILLKAVTAFVVSILISITMVYGRRLLIEDFNKARFINYLNGIHNSWINNPNDNTISCEAGFQRSKRGFSLRLEYDIDSALTYFYSPLYILDYSVYSPLGLANSRPHTAFGGYYFMLNGADLSKYRYLVFFVMGDEEKGYTRRLQVELKTLNQASSFVVEGITNKWKKIVVPLKVFETIDNWHKIEELTIILNENVTEKKGVIYFDDIYFVTDPTEIDSIPAEIKKYSTSKEQEEPQLFLSKNIGINYRYIPERKNELFYAGNITMEGQSGRMTGRMKTSIGSQEFGQSVYLENLDDYPYTQFGKNNPEISVPTIQFKIDNLSPFFNNITIGNIWVGYSPYIMAPFWGWRGILTSGKKGPYDHSTFIIKRHLNSFSAGNRSLYYLGNHRLKLVGIYDYETARLMTSSQKNATQTKNDELTIKPVSYEQSYLLNTLLRFFDNRLNVELNYANYNYKRMATADYSDPVNPNYNQKVSSPTITDNLLEAKLFLDGVPYYGSKFLLSYRDIGTNFTPRFRQEPVIFEDVFADQQGYNIRMEQWYRSFSVNVYWDSLIRKSDNSFYRRTLNYGIKYIGPQQMQLRLNKEYKRDKYRFNPLSIDRNEKSDKTIIYGEYNFLYPITPGIRFPLTLKLIFTTEKKHDYDEDKDKITNTLEMDFNYRLAADFGFAVTYNTGTDNFNLFLNGNF